MPRLRRILLALVAVLGLTFGAPLVLAAPPATAAAKKKPKVKCKAGTIPKITGSGKKAKLMVKRGKAVCVKPPKAKPTQIEPAAPTPQGTISSTADQLTQALAVKPDALAKIEQKLGKKATKALTDRAMNGWRTAAQSQARRLADDGGFHYKGDFGDAAKGTTGSARLDAGPAGEGGQGIKASATIGFSADSKGLKELGADKVTSAKKAGVKIEISFEDAPTACPTAAGKGQRAAQRLGLAHDHDRRRDADDVGEGQRHLRAHGGRRCALEDDRQRRRQDRVQLRRQRPEDGDLAR